MDDVAVGGVDVGVALGVEDAIASFSWKKQVGAAMARSPRYPLPKQQLVSVGTPLSFVKANT